ncbi:hypothetical protein D1P53_001418 [Cryptococcus gattii VGV]|nr:hypothetical protein D1P53_001418 [Cryptococcus gattii VGV]
MLNYVMLVSRQGKVRLAKWFQTLPAKTKNKIVKDVTQLVLARRTRMCNFLEYKGEQAVDFSRDSMPLLGPWYKFLDVLRRGGDEKNKGKQTERYASLFFITSISPGDNELITLEIIHRYVEVLDRYFGNVCELDLIFNFQKAYAVLDELIIAGEIQESSKKTVLKNTMADGVIVMSDRLHNLMLLKKKGGKVVWSLLLPESLESLGDRWFELGWVEDLK